MTHVTSCDVASAFSTIVVIRLTFWFYVQYASVGAEESVNLDENLDVLRKGIDVLRAAANHQISNAALYKKDFESTLRVELVNQQQQVVVRLDGMEEAARANANVSKPIATCL